MVINSIKGPWLIGGSGRSGKTTLVNLIDKSNNSIFGFPLELLINVYDNEYVPNFRKNKNQLCNEYINRTRYMDVERKIKKSLLDLIKSKENKKKFLKIPEYITNSIQLIDWIMSVYTQDMNCDTWAAFDLHPEFKYEKYSSFIDNLNLLVMIRDPREVIAEIIYWRGEPFSQKHRKRKFYHSLISWCLSIKITTKLIKRYPEKVQTIFFNNLVNRKKNEQNKLDTYFKIDSSLTNRTYNNIYYSYDQTEGHLLPSGGRSQLLDKYELDMINKICIPLLNELGYVTDKEKSNIGEQMQYSLVEKIIIVLVNFNNYNFMRSLNEFIFFPNKSIKRKYENLKNIIRKKYLFS